MLNVPEADLEIIRHYKSKPDRHPQSIEFYENEAEGREGVANSLNFLNTVNTENPNSMIMQFFLQGKSSELVKVFGKGNSDMKTRVRDILSKLDITNTAAYKELK